MVADDGGELQLRAQRGNQREGEEYEEAEFFHGVGGEGEGSGAGRSGDNYPAVGRRASTSGWRNGGTDAMQLCEFAGAAESGLTATAIILLRCE